MPSFICTWKDLQGTLKQELDFENEGRNGERCYEELKALKYVHVPLVRWDLTSKVCGLFWMQHCCNQSRDFVVLILQRWKQGIGRCERTLFAGSSAGTSQFPSSKFLVYLVYGFWYISGEAEGENWKGVKGLRWCDRVLTRNCILRTSWARAWWPSYCHSFWLHFWVFSKQLHVHNTVLIWMIFDKNGSFWPSGEQADF